jgi:hypothetical protein
LLKIAATFFESTSSAAVSAKAVLALQLAFELLNPLFVSPRGLRTCTHILGGTTSSGMTRMILQKGNMPLLFLFFVPKLRGLFERLKKTPAQL